MPPKRDEAALQEEEELQLAIALSQSEAEEKERMVSCEFCVYLFIFICSGMLCTFSLIKNHVCVRAHAEAEDLVPGVPQSRPDSGDVLRSTRQHSLLLSCGKEYAVCCFRCY